MATFGHIYFYGKWFLRSPKSSPGSPAAARRSDPDPAAGPPLPVGLRGPLAVGAALQERAGAVEELRAAVALRAAVIAERRIPESRTAAFLRSGVNGVVNAIGALAGGLRRIGTLVAGAVVGRPTE